MEQALGDRNAFLCREATKIHEEYARGTLAEIRALLASRESVKGEVALVVEGAGPAPPPVESVEEAFAALVAQGLTRREAVKEAARRLGLPAREVYRRVL